MAGIKRFLHFYEIQIQCRLLFVNLFTNFKQYEKLFLCPVYNLLALSLTSGQFFILSYLYGFFLPSTYFCLRSYFSSTPYPSRYILTLVVYSSTAATITVTYAFYFLRKVSSNYLLITFLLAWLAGYEFQIK